MTLSWSYSATTSGMTSVSKRKSASLKRRVKFRGSSSFSWRHARSRDASASMSGTRAYVASPSVWWCSPLSSKVASAPSSYDDAPPPPPLASAWCEEWWWWWRCEGDEACALPPRWLGDADPLAPPRCFEEEWCAPPALPSLPPSLVPRYPALTRLGASGSRASHLKRRSDSVPFSSLSIHSSLNISTAPTDTTRGRGRDRSPFGCAPSHAAHTVRWIGYEMAPELRTARAGRCTLRVDPRG